jgi:hypothetical protein
LDGISVTNGGSPANGSNDLRFTLYTTNSGGVPLGTNTLINQPVNNGVFVVELDFGDVFDGSGRWLEIAARPGGSANPFSPTYPRQKLTAAPYAAYANNGMPPGAITAFGGTNPPIGWILCDGRTVSRTAYARLFSAIGTSWGSGDGSTTFNVPDMRGTFLRGVDNSPVTGVSGRDPDRTGRIAIQPGGATGNAVGSFQSDTNKIVPDVWLWFGAESTTGYGAGLSYQGRGSTQTRPPGWPQGAETRPKNAAVNYLIKY